MGCEKNVYFNYNIHFVYIGTNYKFNKLYSCIQTRLSSFSRLQFDNNKSSKLISIPRPTYYNIIDYLKQKPNRRYSSLTCMTTPFFFVVLSVKPGFTANFAKCFIFAGLVLKIVRLQ